MPTQDQLTQLMEASFIPFLHALEHKLAESVRPLFAEYELQDGREFRIVLVDWLAAKHYRNLLAVDKKISFYFIFKKYMGTASEESDSTSAAEASSVTPFNYDIKTALHMQADKYMITYGSKVLVSKAYGDLISEESRDKLTSQALDKSLKRIRAKAEPKQSV